MSLVPLVVHPVEVMGKTYDVCDSLLTDIYKNKFMIVRSLEGCCVCKLLVSTVEVQLQAFLCPGDCTNIAKERRNNGR